MSDATPPAASPTEPAAASAVVEPAAIVPEGPPGALTDAPAAEPAPAAPVVPEVYEFKAPEIEGKAVEVNPEALSALQAVAKEAGLTQAQFQAMGEHGSRIVAERIEAATKAGYEQWHATQRDWQATVKADPEIGGARLPESMSFAARAIDQFGGADLREALNTTGAGNNPAVVRAFVAMGRLMADPTSLSTGKPAAGQRAVTHEQAARDMYNAGGGSYAPTQV